MLAEVARRLASQARAGELVARTGGEEFAWIIPEVEGFAAWQAAERAREVVASAPFPDVGRITLSAGVGDLSQARFAGELFRCADEALYWAKTQGRNATVLYSSEVVPPRTARERAERLERARAIAGLQTVARAVDARDGDEGHHERVAEVAGALADALGWPASRRIALHEAALLHDVGRLAGVGEDDPRHGATAADILDRALSPEQVAWVRAHHERRDGRGGPDGLTGDEIPDGARILAVVETWERECRAGRHPAEALAECRRQAGAGLCPEVVEVLAAVVEGRKGAGVGR